MREFGIDMAMEGIITSESSSPHNSAPHPPSSKNLLQQNNVLAVDENPNTKLSVLEPTLGEKAAGMQRP